MSKPEPRLIGEIVDQLEIRTELGPNDFITDMVCVFAIENPNSSVPIIGISPGRDTNHIVQRGLLETALDYVKDSIRFRSPEDEEEYED
jgi:hypothetical protein